jgi:hypothetical protein
MTLDQPKNVLHVAVRAALVAAVWMAIATAAVASGGGGHGGGGHGSGDSGGGHGGGHGATAEEDAVEVSDVSADGSRAVKLGEFRIRVYHTVSSRKDTVGFILHAVVGKEEFETFERSYPHRIHKVRDQVVVATRLVPIDDYDDPELKRFRRRILLRLRRTLPELEIEDVVLSDFSLMSEAT